MPPRSEGQHHGQDPSIVNGELSDTAREVMYLVGEEIEYGIQPGNPESRLPLESQTELIKSIGLDETDVMAELRLGEFFKVWLVRSKEDSYALINGDAAENLASQKLIARENFMKTFVRSLNPGQRIVIGREHETLGTNVVSRGNREHGNIMNLSRTHVTIELKKRAFGTNRQDVIICDNESTNGTTVERGMKEKEVNKSPDLIDEIPTFLPSKEQLAKEVAAIDREKAVADLEEKLSDERFKPLQELLKEIAEHRAGQRAWQNLDYGVDAQKAEQSAGRVMQKIRKEYPKIYSEYTGIRNKIDKLRHSKK